MHNLAGKILNHEKMSLTIMPIIIGALKIIMVVLKKKKTNKQKLLLIKDLNIIDFLKIHSAHICKNFL